MWIAPILTEKAQRIHIGLVLGSIAILYLVFWGSTGEKKGVFQQRAETVRTKALVPGMYLKDVDSIQRERVAVSVAWEMAGDVPWDEFQEMLKDRLSPEFRAAEQQAASELVLREVRHAEIHSLTVSRLQEGDPLHVRIRYSVNPW